MRLALAQINPTVGAIGGNVALIRGAIERAREGGADLVVLPELAVSGYPPRDLLLQEGFVRECAAAAKELGESATEGLTVVFGCPLPVEVAAVAPGAAMSGTASTAVANSLLVYRDNRYVEYYDKRLLPTYDVFDEDRYFVPGDRAVVVDVPTKAGRSWRVGLSVCEDLWRGEDVGFSHRYATRPDPVAELCAVQADGKAGAELIVNPSASPFVLGKGARHRNLLKRQATHHKVWVAAVNQVGGNDELVFDGSAAVYSPSGALVVAGPGFEEGLVVVDVPAAGGAPREGSADAMSAAPEEELLYRALVLGVRDYLRKTGFRTAVLGLSGGIDSAVVCVLAAAALGPANVTGVSLPSRYSSEGSKTDAHELARRLGVRCLDVPIEGPFAAMLGALAPVLAGKAADVTEENLQSRARGTILMALSNKFGHLLLTTGNKSEMAVGYATLYGDMNGGLAVLADVSKTLVYRLARWMNAEWRGLGIAGLSGPPIPEASITKPPSAELRPGQTDQDTLPAYDVLDEILRRYVEGRQARQRIVEETGFEGALVGRVCRMIDVSEFKRRQAAPGLKVTGVAFGSGRRMPIAQGYRGGV